MWRLRLIDWDFSSTAEAVTGLLLVAAIAVVLLV
jgi:hypothetical protein